LSFDETLLTNTFVKVCIVFTTTFVKVLNFDKGLKRFKREIVLAIHEQKNNKKRE
jgi:hypothetical protein